MHKHEPSPLDGLFLEERTKSFEKLLELLDGMPGGGKDWMFRGHRCVNWKLNTSFDRAVKRFGQPPETWWRLEGCLLRQFQRRDGVLAFAMQVERDTGG